MTDKEKRWLSEDREAIREAIHRRVAGSPLPCPLCEVGDARDETARCVAVCPMARHFKQRCSALARDYRGSTVDCLAALYLELGGTVDTLVRVL